MISTLLISGCETETKENPVYESLWGQFDVINQRTNPEYGDLFIVYDRVSKVMYYCIFNSRRAALTPIYNEDGTVRIYTERTNEDQ